MIDKDINALKKIRIYNQICRLKNTKILYTKLVLKYKHGRAENLQKYKALLVMCVDKEAEDDEDTFSLVTDLTVIKFSMYSASQKESYSNRSGFQTPLLKRDTEYFDACSVANRYLHIRNTRSETDQTKARPLRVIRCHSSFLRLVVVSICESGCDTS